MYYRLAEVKIAEVADRERIDAVLSEAAARRQYDCGKELFPAVISCDPDRSNGSTNGR